LIDLNEGIHYGDKGSKREDAWWKMKR